MTKLFPDEVIAKQEHCVNWVTNFRELLSHQKLVDHAFINFVDKDLGKKSVDTPKNRYKLLQQYYPGKLNQLIEIKKAYDSDNLFKFPMSIPTEAP